MAGDFVAEGRPASSVQVGPAPAFVPLNGIARQRYFWHN
jgi:hypothetical protein